MTAVSWLHSNATGVTGGMPVTPEFRTPLTVIREYASLLCDDVLGQLKAEQCRLLHVITDRSDELNNMVNNMLDSSRLNMGILSVDRCACEAADIVRQVEESLQRKAVLRDVSIEFHIAPELPTVYCDSEKAARILTNLTINAIKFSGDPGQVVVRVYQAAPGEDVAISVADNGPGIAKDEQQIIFDRFRQIGTSTRSSTQGFGLGLSIVHELVGANFGQLEVASESGNGSMFSFTLPLHQPAEIARRYTDRLAHKSTDPARVSVISASLTETDAACGNMKGFWQRIQRGRDLALQVRHDCWLYLVACGEVEVTNVVDRINRERNEANRNRAQAPLAELNLKHEGTWWAKAGRDAFNHCLEQLCETGASLKSPADHSTTAGILPVSTPSSACSNRQITAPA
ncbi:MAG: HAMP domain-containing sensor histidine kinase [Planctomycetaceae bacterium]